MKTEKFSSTGADIVNCLHFNVVYIYFALDFCTLLRMRVTTNIRSIVPVNS